MELKLKAEWNIDKLPDLYIYNAGNTYNNITGGYDKIAAVSSDINLVSFESDCINLKARVAGNAGISAITKNMIDITGYKYVNIDRAMYGDSSGSGWMNFFLVDSNNSVIYSASSTKRTRSWEKYDISGYANGKYYTRLFTTWGPAKYYSVYFSVD